MAPPAENGKAPVKKADGPPATGRVIVKQLPKHATEARLKEYFSAVGEVTDCRLRKTKSGESRQFAFVGFRNEDAAKKAIKELNRSFFDTSKILVEAAHAIGSDALVRPWSRYAKGSSSHKKQHPELYDTEGNKKQPEGGKADALKKDNRVPDVKAPKGARKCKTSVVKAGKAGVNAHRTHVEFDSDEDMAESEPETAPAVRKPADKDAFDDDLDDLAYLRKKSAAPAEDSAEAVKKSNAAEDSSDSDDDDEELGAEDEKAMLDTGDKAASKPEPKTEKNPVQDEPGAAMEELESSGRLYVTNLPYGATEDELRAHFEPLGELAAVWVCKDEDSLKSRGFGYISYVFPECAVRALSQLDMQSFQGRLLRIAAAKARPPPAVLESEASMNTASTSYKKQREKKLKKVDAHLEHTWILLYVSANSAADVASKQLGVSKSELFGKDAENVAVTAALTETSVINQTKLWLKREGIRVDAFEQKGASLAKSRMVTEAESKRRDDTFIVKHLPASASGQELRERFARYGELVRCSLAPSGTVAVVQYTDKTQAKRAFQKLAFSRYQHVPLYLEWAPEDVFDGSGAGQAKVNETAGGASGSRSAPDAKAPAGEADEDAEDAAEEARGCLFVKNLNFATTEALLKAAFGGFKGFKSAVVMRKKVAVTSGKKKEDEGQSMGYGFLEFATPADAADVLRRSQGKVVDGHALQLQVSQRNANRGKSASSAGGAAAGKRILTSPRLCVRNLAFEVTKKELSQLFGAYGSLTAVRIPKKADYTGHRGFGFIDFASKSEASAAFEALQHTHLYGRRLVIEAAEEKSNDVETVQETATKRKASRALTSEAKKKRRAGVLNASGGTGGAFQDALV